MRRATKQNMTETIETFPETEPRSQDALKYLAEIASAAAAQKDHDARMMTATSASTTAVRQVLEESALRARRLAWVAGCVGGLVVIASLTITAQAIRSAATQNEQHLQALLVHHRELSAAETLEIKNEAIADTLREERNRQHEMIGSVLTELARTGSRFADATVQLANAITARAMAPPLYVTPITRRDGGLQQVTPLAATNPASIRPVLATPSAAPSQEKITPATPNESARVFAAAYPTRYSGRERTLRSEPEEFEVFLNMSGRCTSR